MNVLALIRPQFLYVSLFLLIVGSVIKYRTELYNKLIAIILFMASFFLCSLWGFFTSSFVGVKRIVDAFMYCGLIQGLFVASIPVFGWDTVYGLWKYGVIRKKTKEFRK